MNSPPQPTSVDLFNQQPVGNSCRLMVDQYPPDFDPTKIQAKIQPPPLAKRISSKVLKIRLKALEELLDIVSSSNYKQFIEHSNSIVSFLSDSNYQCQMLSAKIIFFYLEKEGSYNGDHKGLLKNLIEKILTNEKEEAQKVGMDLIFWLVDHSYQQMVLLDLNEYLVSKNPKIVGTSFKILQILLSNYGLKKLNNFDLFTKNLKLQAENARPMAKMQTVELFKEIYKWIGPKCFQSFTIHHQVKEQLQKWAKTYQMKPMEIKRGFKKSEQAKTIIFQDNTQQDSTPVDVLQQFDSLWVDKTLQIEKWQVKKEYLEDFIKKTNVNVIVPRQCSHFIKLVKCLFKDNNINLIQSGFKVVRNLCKGLKRHFAAPCKSFLPYIYLKLKDSKAMIVDGTLATLKIMTESITLEDLQQQITAGLKDKSPQMRINTLKLLKEICYKKQGKTSKILKVLLSNLIELTNDSNSQARDLALDMLCKIKGQYDMVFFEDKLEKLPTKKVNQIRSTPTLGIQEELNQKMEIQEASSNSSKFHTLSASLPEPKRNINLNKQNKLPQQKKRASDQTNPFTQISQTSQVVKKTQSIVAKSGISKHQETLEIKNHSQLQKKEKRQSTQIISMTEAKQQDQNEKLQNENLMNQLHQEWPLVPTPAHVMRLMNLFNRMGEPFRTLATPFKLKDEQVLILQTCQSQFIIKNANLILKWALWRIQIEEQRIIQKIASVVVHVTFLLKNSLTDSQTILVMSILSNLLESELCKSDLLRCINISILQISDSLREKVFNFWITTLNNAISNPQFCEKILHLLKNAFQHESFNPTQIVTMARSEAINRSRGFMDFLLSKCSRETLKVSGFKFNQYDRARPPMTLKLSESDFISGLKVDQRSQLYQMFRRNSREFAEQLQKRERSCLLHELMDLHVKLMDTFMIPYLEYSIQSINVYNYLKNLQHLIEKIVDTDHITPYLRSIVRLLMFFLVDLSDSKMDNKNDLGVQVNKVIIAVLQKAPADHLLQVMTMLLRYVTDKNMTKRLTQLLLKCIKRTSLSQGFCIKAQKNVKTLLNFFITFIQQFGFKDEDFVIQTVSSIFQTLFKSYKQLCMEIVYEKWNDYNGWFFSKRIQKMFKYFLGISDDSKAQQAKNEINPTITNENQSFLLNANPSNKEITLADTANKISQERNRVKAYQGLCQSFEGLVKMKEGIILLNSNQNFSSVNPQINEEKQNSKKIQEPIFAEINSGALGKIV